MVTDPHYRGHFYFSFFTALSRHSTKSDQILHINRAWQGKFFKCLTNALSGVWWKWDHRLILLSRCRRYSLSRAFFYLHFKFFRMYLQLYEETMCMVSYGMYGNVANNIYLQNTILAVSPCTTQLI